VGSTLWLIKGSGILNVESAVAEEGGRPVLLFVVNVAWFFRMHRLHIARTAQAAGFEVHVATAPDAVEDVQLIEKAGLRHHSLVLRRGRWSFLEELGLTVSLWRLYRQIRPDIVHHVTIKPVLCGTLAARLARVTLIVNAMSGLGFVFTAKDRWASLRRTVVKMAYRVLFARPNINIIFENSDDLELFYAGGLIRRHQAVLIRGAGVDLDRFRLQSNDDAIPLVVLPARMLWDKGVREFCEAAAAIRSDGVQARFALVGGLDPGNPAAIPVSWLEDRQREGAVEWWGHQQDIASVYARARIVCLPSYREGLPTVLLEGAACGCALVATNVPGCREVVQDGKTGLLVPAHDSASLANALRAVIGDPDLRRRLASAALVHVRAEFSADRVGCDTLNLYRKMLNVARAGV
jgi:glycosyltransferase involved in cell wall biosynthesis